jgi:miniconductance mechanosensitive channel
MHFFIVNSYTFTEKFKDLLLQWGFSIKLSNLIVDFFGLFVIFAASVMVYAITRFIIRRVLKRLVLRSASKWDDYLYENKVFTRLALLIPAIVLHLSLSSSIADYPKVIHFLDVLLEVYSVLVIILVINSFFNAVYQIYGDLSVANSKPIKGYLQIARIIVFLVGGIIITSFLIGQSPLNLLAGLGAISAVLLLIFKDSILGFVAGVQISTNNMLQIGDWMSMPKHNADGVVIDISLVIVKVRNFDNSVVTIPTYSLITESFQNWRGMIQDGGRRIKRAILLDVHSIRYCDQAILDTIRKYDLPHTVPGQPDEQFTNLGLFRSYIKDYLRLHPDINQQMVILVRQLPSNENGVPLEIYAFSVLEDLGEFENFQSKLFEHLFSVVAEFGLRIYQRPSQDFRG